jgi:hypothetical protein
VQKPPLVIEAQNSDPGRSLNPATTRPLTHLQGSESLYREDGFRLLRRELEEFSHILASREGLYAIGLGGIAKIADGQFFGITVQDAALHCFEALGPIPQFWPHRGRIVKISISQKKIVSTEVVVKGLPNGCHQIDFVGGKLIVCDTYNTRLFVVEPDFRAYTSFSPWGDIGFQDFAKGYPHVNSVVGFEGVIHLMLHHCSRYTGRNSQIVGWLPGTGQLGVPRTLAGRSCHNIVFLEDGSLLVCDSDGGALSDGARCLAKLGDMFTRGLSIDSEFVVVGSSLFSRRDSRRTVAGDVCFLDRGYRELARFVLPAAATEIRKIDGRDLSLTNFRSGGS